MINTTTTIYTHYAQTSVPTNKHTTDYTLNNTKTKNVTMNISTLNF